MDSFETLIFFRGVSVRYDPQHPTIHETRRNRRPKDASIEFHNAADRWFHSRFGVLYRSQALLLTSRQLTANVYAATPAHVMRILPLSDYRYCWSPNAVDLLFAAKKLEGASPSEIEDHLTSLGYREDGLAEAHVTGHEVMLHCDRYITIPVQLVSGNGEENTGSSILLDKF
ncbi:MAG: hypothetical protein Q8O00_07600 [Holophaga sp.]|nr:hypothetical protein [Holophaga sp.]